MAQATRSRTRIATVLFLCSCLWLAGTAADRARAGGSAERRAELLQLTNEARDQKDRGALALDVRLSRYAIRHSRAMAEAGQLFHTKDVADKLGQRNWSMWGENIGYASSLPDVQAAFMGSTPHRKNILRTGFDHTAIGVVESDGHLWVTVIFYG